MSLSPWWALEHHHRHPWSSLSEQRANTQVAPGECLPLVTFCPLGICFQPPTPFPTWPAGLCNQTIQFPIWPSHFLACWMTLDKLFTVSELRVPYLRLLTTELILQSYGEDEVYPGSFQRRGEPVLNKL